MQVILLMHKMHFLHCILCVLQTKAICDATENGSCCFVCEWGIRHAGAGWVLG